VRRLDGCSRLFLVALAVYLTGRYLGRPLIPYSGSVAVTALGALIWTRPLPRDAVPWSRYPLVAGLALLAGALALPDALVLTATAYAAIGLGVLARAAPLRRWSNLPSVVFALFVIGAAVALVRAPLGLARRVPPDVLSRAGAVMLPVVVLIVLGFAVNAALTSGVALRWAGAGLVPVLALAIPILPAVLAAGRFAPPPLPDDQVASYFAQEAARRPVLALHDPAEVELPEVALSQLRPLPLPAPTRQDPPPISAVRSAIQQIREVNVDPEAALESEFLFLGLAAIATALFPYRE
jgi:hypothetical protein